MIKILVDTLGGDKSPTVNIEGAIKAINEIDDIETKNQYNIAIKALQAIAQRDNDYSSMPFLDCRKCAKNALKKLGENYSMNNKLNKEDK